MSRVPAGNRDFRKELEELESRDVPTLLGQQLFPSDYPINQNIADAPVAANSAAIINHIGASIHIHPDVGYDSSSNGNDPLYGIPFNVVHGNSVPKVNVVITNYPGESDIVPVPIPANAVIEGDYQDGPNLNGPGYNSGQRGDSHLIIWDEDNNIAYELFGVSRPNDITNHTGEWEAAQESVWNMNTDTFRSLGWTSADAAGLSILEGLVRPDEGLPVSQGGQGAIDHALRFTLPSGDINPQYIYPASHEISVSSQSDTSLPMGARLRLANNPTVDALISQMGPEAQIIATAMQQYGLILADDGSPMYVTFSSGSVDANNNLDLVWDMPDVLGLESLSASDFQVVNLTPIVTGVSSSVATAGSKVTITGENFSGAAGHLSVFFGATASPSVTFVTDTEITAVVPQGSGTVNVTVQSGVNETDNNSDSPSANANAPIFGYGNSAVTSADQFTFITQTVSASNSSLSFASGTDISGMGDLITFTIVDTNADAIAELPGSAFQLSLGGGTSDGTFGNVTATTTPGTYTVTFTGTTAGSASSLTATVAGVELDAESLVLVTPGSADGGNSSAGFAASTDVSGTGDLVTIVLEDAAGNAITGVTGSDIILSLTGENTGSFGPVEEVSSTNTYTSTFTGLLVGSPSTLDINVNGVSWTTSAKVTVTPGSVDPDSSSYSYALSSVTSGQTDTVTIVVKDAAGNAITGLTSGDFDFAPDSGTSTGNFGALTASATPGTYTAFFTGVLAGSPRVYTLNVNGVQLASQPSILVNAGGVSSGNSKVSIASPSLASGTSEAVTIQAEDAAGNAIAGLAGSAFVFSLAGGTTTGTFGPVVPGASSGTYTTTFTGLVAGTASTLSLKINGQIVSSHPQIAVTPGAASGSKSSVSLASVTLQSGKTDVVTLVLKDAAGNAVADLSSNDFSFAFSGTSSATFGPVDTTTTPGKYTVTMTGTTAGTASSLIVTVEGTPLTASPKVTVTHGALSATTSIVTVGSPTLSSGQADPITITLADAYGNPIPGIPSTDFTLAFSGGTSTGTLSGVSATTTPGTYSARLAGVVAGTASIISVKVGSVVIGTKPTVQVIPGVISSIHSTVSVTSAVLASGAKDIVTAHVKDSAGNAITGLSSEFAPAFTGGTSTGTLGSVTELVPGTYTFSLTGEKAGSAGSLSVTVDGFLLAAEPKVTVVAGSVNAVNSTVSLASGTVAPGFTDTLTITVEDAVGNPVGNLGPKAFTFVLAGGTSTGTFGTVTATKTVGVYTVTFRGVAAGTDTALTVEVDGITLAGDPTIQVT